MFRPALCCSSRALVRGLAQPGHIRRLFSLPNFSDLAPWDTTEAQKYHEQKILPYGQKELYDVVADVGSYHHFIPFCTGSRIVTPSRQSSSHERHTPLPMVMEAELTVGFLAFTERYASQVNCRPYESVEASASTSTPLFKTLTTKWRFQPAPAQSFQSLSAESSVRRQTESTLVTLDLVYAFANPIHASVSSAFFGQVSKLMVKAFEDRCRTVYGPRSS